MAVSTQSSTVESVTSGGGGDWSSSDEDDYGDYYGGEDGDMSCQGTPQDASFQSDPEHYSFSCLSTEETWNYLDAIARVISKTIKSDVPLARALLHCLQWNTKDVVTRYSSDRGRLLTEAHMLPATPTSHLTMVSSCPVCLTPADQTSLQGVGCGHLFCSGCWDDYVSSKIRNGVSTSLECMQCPVRLSLEMVQLFLKTNTHTTARYLELSLSEYVLSHTLLRWCPGPDCSIVFQVEERQPKRVECSKCRTNCCFMCGDVYHLPSDCETLRTWMNKCSDDSETANYILANTKDCPKCKTAIEKNGGCNHINCTRCSYDFCWMCLGEWRSHTGYFECNKYKAEKDTTNRARQALEKYLFYYQRWANHTESLRLEEETKRKIVDRIEEKVSSGCGTWIDWQYLIDAAELLRKCRYTLKYTYPFAYYEEGERKPLFEYQQAQLEVEIENLSWKIERAESTDVADIRQQMNVTEVQRLTLLRDFVP
ncbi:E3 ubiquitin-protein ligase ARIH2-like [Halichondria panicea]|uniref:E3 ubiquitin-protein ligase ARIH2-like n=1 Tax=Halichondria panicea TaxID=6063 RepID=UPI00312B626D